MSTRLPKKRLTREESQAQTRERLLEAATRVFANGGYGGASVDQIAAEAGFSKGAFYSNFETKEAIFLELLGRHKTREVGQLNRILADDSSAESMLSALDRWLDALNVDADWSLLAAELQLHALRSPAFASAYKALNDEHEQQLGGLIAKLFQRAGKALPAKASELATLMMALPQGLALQRAERPTHSDPSGKLIKLVLQSLLKSAARR